MEFLYTQSGACTGSSCAQLWVWVTSMQDSSSWGNIPGLLVLPWHVVLSREALAQGQQRLCVPDQPGKAVVTGFSCGGMPGRG